MDLFLYTLLPKQPTAFKRVKAQRRIIGIGRASSRNLSKEAEAIRKEGYSLKAGRRTARENADARYA